MALYQVDPFGERRADLRSAISTTNTIVSGSPAKIEVEDIQELFKQILNYLEANQDNEEAVDLDALQRMKERQSQ